MDDYQRVERLRQKIAQCERQTNRTYENLVQWGGALLELSVYEDKATAQERLQAAIVKLNLARYAENGGDHDNLWLLGCAHALLLQVIPKEDVLRQHHKERSSYFFSEAKRIDPTNDIYRNPTKDAVTAFFTSRFTWGAISVTGVLCCVWKYAFGRKKA